MRYAVFSDVHGNLEAYTAGLPYRQARRIDAYICAGDIVGYGADPSRCIAETRRITGTVVAGNHDRAGAGALDLAYFNRYAGEAAVWTGTVIDAEDRAYLAGLPLVSHENDIDTAHGTLDAPGEFRYVFDAGDAADTFGLMRSPVCFIGHTHAPAAYCEGREEMAFRSGAVLRLGPGRRYVINVGSVGQPRDGDPRGSYAIYDTEDRSVQLRRFSYDIKRAAGKILEAGLPPFLAQRLSAGR